MGLFGSKKKSEEVMRSGEAILSDGTAIGVARQVKTASGCPARGPSS